MKVEALCAGKAGGALASACQHIMQQWVCVWGGHGFCCCMDHVCVCMHVRLREGNKGAEKSKKGTENGRYEKK